MENLKDVCLRAIQFDEKNPKIELKYPRTYDNVVITQIGPVQGFMIRQDPLHDVYEFNAREVLAHLEEEDLSTMG